MNTPGVGERAHLPYEQALDHASVLQIYSELQIASGDGEQHVDITRLSGNGKVDSDTEGAGAQSALPFEQLGMSFSHGE